MTSPQWQVPEPGQEPQPQACVLPVVLVPPPVPPPVLPWVPRSHVAEPLLPPERGQGQGQEAGERPPRRASEQPWAEGEPQVQEQGPQPLPHR